MDRRRPVRLRHPTERADGSRRRSNLATGARTHWKDLAPPSSAGARQVYAIQLSPEHGWYFYSSWHVLSDLYEVDGISRRLQRSVARSRNGSGHAENPIILYVAYPVFTSNVSSATVSVIEERAAPMPGGRGAGGPPGPGAPGRPGGPGGAGRAILKGRRKVNWSIDWSSLNGRRADAASSIRLLAPSHATGPDARPIGKSCGRLAGPAIPGRTPSVAGRRNSHRLARPSSNLSHDRPPGDGATTAAWLISVTTDASARRPRRPSRATGARPRSCPATRGGREERRSAKL